ncbi:putative secreted protein with PEP-CTERM sorting signal [Micromonospora kangleipakensis]|uniref:Putative secreted protein with PEP-CTERM sorting signal n=1 Tax=Micromonospora kangleipakensis TaxID=1077942 RepID=A0A4V6MGT8_9ACTN|nr:putative secreted protein with PEP-CTERM sorting signal [Micromonospora kangleipakensis]
MGSTKLPSIAVALCFVVPFAIAVAALWWATRRRRK